MLQQTQAVRVTRAFAPFLSRFPSIRALADAPRAEVVRAWEGLGYNRRAVRLSDAARAIVRDHGGRVPSDPATLAALPGIGPYTAAAVASIAFGRPVPAIDVNARRVVGRVLLGAEGTDLAGPDVRAAAERWLDRRDPAGWNQAVMDLGRAVCRPVPRCAECPLVRACEYRARGGGASPAPRRQQPFEGSFRQVRGAVVSALRRTRAATLTSLARSTGHSLEKVALAVADLERDGLVRAGPAARSGRPGGRVALAG
jgi:A/G-specific adenine glycosylase